MKVLEIKLTDIKPGENFRLNSKTNDVSSLMQSIDKDGLLNPVTVRRHKKTNKYVLIAGFRRLAAHKKMGRKSIPAFVKNKTKSDALINLVENIQREDISTFELGRGITALREKHNMSISEVAVRLGLPPLKVKNILDMFEYVPEEFRPIVRQSPKGAQHRNGNIPNDIAHSIVMLQKSNRINADQTKQLFNKVKKNDDVSKEKIKVFSKALINGTSYSEATRMLEQAKSINFKIIMSENNYKKLNKKHPKGLQPVIRKVLENHFKIKFWL